MKKIKNHIRWAAFIILTFVLLNVDLWRTTPSLEIFRDPDEAWYGIVMKQLQISGCQGLPITYLFSDRPNFHSCEWTATLLHLTPGPDLFWQVVTLRLFSRVVITVAIAFFVKLLLGDWLLGILTALAIFLDGGIFFFKPGFLTLQHLWRHELDDFTRMNRIISPMQYQIPMLLWSLTLTTWLLLYLRGKMSSSRQLIFGIVMVVLSIPVVFAPFYAWISYFLLGFWLVAWGWISKPQKQWWAPTLLLAANMISALLIGVSKMKAIPAAEVLPRGGFFSHQWAPLFAVDKGLILGWLLVGVLLWKAFKNTWLAILVPFSFYLLMNLNLLTGREFQNFHFKDYMAVIWWVALLCLSGHLFKEHRKYILGFLVLIITVGTAQHVRSQIERPSFFRAEQQQADMQEILAYTRTLPAQTPVYCGSFYQILPLKTSVRCSWHHLLMTYALSNEELLKQSLAQWRLSGMNREQVQVRISFDANVDRGLGGWSFGVKPAWIEGSTEVDMYSVANLRDKIIPLWMKEYDQMTMAEAARLVDAQFYILKNSEAGQMWQPQKVFSVYGIYSRK